MDKITYSCKACGKWSKSISAAWSDVQPKFCPEPTCSLSLKKGKGKKGFRTSPDMLEITLPVIPEIEVPAAQAKPSKVRRKK